MPTPAQRVVQASTQRWRLLTQAAFFVLFALAPLFDLLRYDLTRGHAYILGFEWHLGLDDFTAGRVDALTMAGRILSRLFLPLVGGAALLLAVAWRWGRLYCGWLCPHFSVVETINHLMRRASGKPSVWEDKPLVARDAAGRTLPVDRRWWLATVPLAVGFAFTWAVVLLTYLMPPVQVYAGIVHLALPRWEALFVGVGTLVLSLEFLFARHLFCRFGCAVGLFQSLAWMSNRGAMVVGFDRPNARHCADCLAASGPQQPACEAACPMRLKPRLPKAQMFTCTQCAQCVAACDQVPRPGEGFALLRWVDGADARRAESRVSLTGRRDT